jgi:hypothetical protein
LLVYFALARKDVSSTVPLEIRVLNAAGSVQLSIDRTVGRNEPGDIRLRIPLETLTPGAYVLRVTAADSRNKATTETGFIVK